jgi:hypothetical protein
VHDGIQAENTGLPSATICTDRFIHTAAAMARLWGAPDYPTIFTEHPIENLTREQLRRRAEGLASEVARVLIGDGR